MRSWSVNSVSQSMEIYVVMKTPLFIEITSVMSFGEVGRQGVLRRG
jgi:hypothetical protein